MSGDQPASGQRTASAPAGDPEPANADRAGHTAQVPKAFIAADDRAQLGGAGAVAALITGQGEDMMNSNGKWTPEAIRALGPTTDLPTLGTIFECSRWKSYQMARHGEWERVGIKVIPIGSKYRVVVQSILEVLGYGSGDSGASKAPRQPEPTRASQPLATPGKQ